MIDFLGVSTTVPGSALWMTCNDVSARSKTKFFFPSPVFRVSTNEFLLFPRTLTEILALREILDDKKVLVFLLEGKLTLNGIQLLTVSIFHSSIVWRLRYLRHCFQEHPFNQRRSDSQKLRFAFTNCRGF